MTTTITYGRFAGACPANTDEAVLYAPASGVEFIGKVNIANLDSSSHAYRLALTDASGAAASDDWIKYDQSISGNSSHSIALECKNPQTLRIKSDSANNITFVAHGMTKTTS